jgi:hypothetical protein
VLVLGGPLASASESSSKSAVELRAMLLTTQRIAQSTGMESPVGRSGIGCGVDFGKKATYCQYRRLGSREARSAGAPWASHLAIMSFDSQAEAETFFAGRLPKREGVLVIASTSTTFVASQSDPHPNGAAITAIGPQASAFQVIGSDVVLAACTDSRRPVNGTAIVDCAQSLAAAQASAVG